MYSICTNTLADEKCFWIVRLCGSRASVWCLGEW